MKRRTCRIINILSMKSGSGKSLYFAFRQIYGQSRDKLIPERQFLAVFTSYLSSFGLCLSCLPLLFRVFSASKLPWKLFCQRLMIGEIRYAISFYHVP